MANNRNRNTNNRNDSSNNDSSHTTAAPARRITISLPAKNARTWRENNGVHYRTLAELAVPVTATLTAPDGSTVTIHGTIPYSLSHRKGGRTPGGDNGELRLSGPTKNRFDPWLDADDTKAHDGFIAAVAAAAKSWVAIEYPKLKAAGEMIGATASKSVAAQTVDLDLAAALAD